ncbi:MAG: sulfate adenylyltransferase subunit CysN [Pseudomonadota bacterium]|nr:sulfate adenylyltransferase subunit CysN [Pseudomonadota bacterium]
MPNGVLRLLTCGSVDDGKSTLIGRLLYDTKLLLEDQLSALHEESGGDKDLDFSYLLDGLNAEREQGITIDVAYRFFATEKRHFIVADTPGHEQYTRNMATGASTSDVAILLVDARNGILTQTRRHSHIISMFGIRHVVLAVNKMDLMDYSEDRFSEISEAFVASTQTLNFDTITCIPVSALKGDNLRKKSVEMAWYRGPTLLDVLESLDTLEPRTQQPFRLPIQWINRPDADFRGYSGTVASGQIHVQDEIVVVPSFRKTKVDRIVTMDADRVSAQAGDAITLTFTDEVDAQRGDVIAPSAEPPDSSDQFRVQLLWMDQEPMLPGRNYEIKIGTQTTRAVISDLRYTINVNTAEQVAARTMNANEIGVCNISLQRTVAFDPYESNKQTGAFILIDRYTKQTVAAGRLEYGLRRATNITRQEFNVDKSARAQLKSQKPCVLWFTGLSGSGKSTIANRVESELHALGHHTYILDGDNVRHGLNKDLGFTDADRVENIRRISEVSRLFADAGLIVLVSFISPFRSEREMARSLLEAGEFVEIFIDTPLDICEQRDPKGLYVKARAGEIANFTGIDSNYEAPIDPELRLDTTKLSVDASKSEIIEYLRNKGIV